LRLGLPTTMICWRHHACARPWQVMHWSDQESMHASGPHVLELSDLSCCAVRPASMRCESSSRDHPRMVLPAASLQARSSVSMETSGARATNDTNRSPTYSSQSDSAHRTSHDRTTRRQTSQRPNDSIKIARYHCSHSEGQQQGTAQVTDMDYGWRMSSRFSCRVQLHADCTAMPHLHLEGGSCSRSRSRLLTPFTWLNCHEAARQS